MEGKAVMSVCKVLRIIITTTVVLLAASFAIGEMLPECPWVLGVVPMLVIMLWPVLIGLDIFLIIKNIKSKLVILDFANLFIVAAYITVVFANA